MKLFKLEANKAFGYDCVDGFVIRAESEQDARKLASENAADEGEEVWLNEDKTTCIVITTEGDTEVILVDFNAG